MQDVNWFERLKGNQIEALLDPSAESLRESYLNILTLLHDLLGRYSSGGNATVIRETRDVDHLLSKALLNIRAFIHETRNSYLPIASPLTLQSNQERALVIIEGRTYHLSPSTGRLIAKWTDRLYLPGYWNESQISKSVKDELGGLARTMSETASSNIKSAQTLKYLSESAKDLSRKTSKGR
jgi:hypothetical protein